MTDIEAKDAARALAGQIVEGRKPVIFMIGSGASLPRRDAGTGVMTPGVPSSQEVVDIIAALLGKPAASLGNYQSAFHMLIGTDGGDLTRANRVIREAVLRVRTSQDPGEIDATPERFAALEADPKQWRIPYAYKALVLLGAHFPAALGGVVLTTNFDPLIEVAMTHARTPWVSTALQEDGSLKFTRGSGPHVVHLHGHWWNSDTLHTEVQLTAQRDKLRDSLLDYLKKSTLVVIGYGGWKDVLTRTLEDPRTTRRTYGGAFGTRWTTRRGHASRRSWERAGGSSRESTPTNSWSGILEASLKQRWADNRDLYLDRVLIENNHAEVYKVCEMAVRARGWGLDSQLRYLEHYETGLSVIACIHAARLVLPLVDQQHVHAAYGWTDGSVARLALIEAARIFHDETADEHVLDAADELLAFHIRDERIPGRRVRTVLDVVQHALRATRSYQM